MSVDSRTPEGVLTTKGNIVSDTVWPSQYEARGRTPRRRITNVGANVVLGDSGDLVAGTYRVRWALVFNDLPATNKGLILQHRDAADAATVEQLAYCPADTRGYARGETLISVAANESVRLISDSAAGAASSVAEVELFVETA